MDQREHELGVIREYLKIGLKKEGFSGTTWIDAYFVKHIEKGMISEELTDPLCLSFHTDFQAEKIEDGTVQGLPTILYRFKIDFDAAETLDKLAEIVRSWYMKGACVMSVRDYANLSCVKFMDELVKMGRNSLFEPYGPNEQGFHVSYRYRDEETLDKLREHVREILYWKKAYCDTDNPVYLISYKDRDRDETEAFTFSYDDFINFVPRCSTVNAAIKEYSVDLLSKVNPKENSYITIKRIDSDEQEEEKPTTKDDVSNPSRALKFKDFIEFQTFCELYKQFDATPRFIAIRCVDGFCGNRFCRIRVENGMVQFSFYAFDEDYPFDDGRVWQRPQDFYDDAKGNFGFDFELVLW